MTRRHGFDDTDDGLFAHANDKYISINCNSFLVDSAAIKRFRITSDASIIFPNRFVAI
jgi:hypothetical protein